MLYVPFDENCSVSYDLQDESIIIFRQEKCDNLFTIFENPDPALNLDLGPSHLDLDQD